MPMQILEALRRGIKHLEETNDCLDEGQFEIGEAAKVSN